VKMSFSRLVIFAVAAWVALAVPMPAFSQSCALCYTQAASSGARMIEALRSGILILVVPPTIMSAFVLYVLHRRSHQFKQAGMSEADRW
jgi:threonine/homoserine/homoserine lactone efflux protein